eukprot:IDg13945t1
MKDNGELALCADENGHALKLQELLRSILRVRWSMVHLSSIRRPRANLVNVPIFSSGDFVPWDPLRLVLPLRDKMVIPVSETGDPTGVECRGVRLAGNLALYPKPTNGQAVCHYGWEGFCYHEIVAPAPEAEAGAANGVGHEKEGPKTPTSSIVVIDLEAEVMVE